DVDVVTGAGRLTDGIDALAGGGDLHEQVGPVDALVQVRRRGGAGVGVVGERGCDLERDEPIAAVARLVQRREQVECLDDVGDHELPVGVLDGRAAADELGELVVVGVGSGDGVGQDGRVGGHPAYPAIHEPFEVPAAQVVTGQVVEPGALA